MGRRVKLGTYYLMEANAEAEGDDNPILTRYISKAAEWDEDVAKAWAKELNAVCC